jgi:hypothetical protein
MHDTLTRVEPFELIELGAVAAWYHFVVVANLVDMSRADFVRLHRS